jgi:HEAT repeat protein
MPKESIETLVTELVHEEDWRRMRATAACVTGGPKAVHALIGALGTASPALKVEIAGMLSRIKDPKGGLPLVRLLKDEDAGVTKAAVLALEQLAGVLEPDAAAALVLDLTTSSSEEHRNRVAALLGVMPNAVRPLCTMLSHPESAGRLAAADMLEHLLDPRCADALVDALADPSLQEIAVRTLKKLGAIRERIDEAFNALRDVEGAVEREEVRMSTVIDLLRIGRPSVEILIEYLQDDDWVVREAAADLLGKIGDARAVEPLMARLRQDPDTGVKEYALKSLGLIGDPRPAELYVEAIPIRPLRVFAMEALAKVKDVEVLKPHADLFERLRTDRDGLVAYSAGIIADKLAAMDSAQAATVGGEDHNE